MRYGVILPGGTAPQQLAQAERAERAGWDGVFVWEAPYGVDAWSLLAAMAARTTRVRLGTMLTPLPWRRPWKVASQVVTLDQLSNGRATLAVGLGATDTPDLPSTGEELDRRTRADTLDESLELIRTLWRGARRYEGKHFTYESPSDDLAEAGRPVQERIPIWVVGVWKRWKSMRRVLRCDGLIPQFQDGPHEGTPDAVRDICSWLARNGRPDTEVIHDGETPTADRSAAAAKARTWADAGCTWWLETRWEMPHNSDARMREIEARIAAGPPSS